MKKTFIIGSSGFVAKTHGLSFNLNQKVIALCDKNRWLLRYFPTQNFF